MRPRRLALGAAGAVLLLALGGLSACGITVDDRILWAPEPVEIDERREDGTGLFLGEALTRPSTISATIRQWHTSKIEVHTDPGAYRPVRVEWLAFAGPEGAIPAVTIAAEGGEDRPLIVHCYGIGADLYNNGTQFALKTLPFGDVLQFDLPGHGRSPGTVSVTDYQAATTALGPQIRDFAGQRPVVYWGHSLGGFTCGQLAVAHGAPRALILETVGEDVERIVRGWAPAIVRPLLRVRMSEDVAEYDLSAILAPLEAPILVLGGEKDGVIREPVVRDFAAALRDDGHRVTYRAFPGADHTTVPQADGFDDLVRTFLAEAGLADPS